MTEECVYVYQGGSNRHTYCKGRCLSNWPLVPPQLIQHSGSTQMALQGARKMVGNGRIVRDIVAQGGIICVEKPIFSKNGVNVMTLVIKCRDKSHF